MKNNFFDKQVSTARENYNYFFIKLVFSILKIVFKLSIILLVSCIFNYSIINIIALIYTIHLLFEISYVIRYYSDIIGDIKKTLKYNDLSFEIDFNLIHGNFFKGVVRYGR